VFPCSIVSSSVNELRTLLRGGQDMYHFLQVQTAGLGGGGGERGEGGQTITLDNKTNCKDLYEKQQ
jgi:hypothetical protein